MGACFPVPINKRRVDNSHFETYRSIGRGGFGSVDVVCHRPSGDIMAMKRSYKDTLLDENRAHVVWVEREVMALIPRDAPFLMPLLYAFQTKREVFVVMPYLCGGDLMYHLRMYGAMNEDHARFYAAEIVVALEQLHALSYIYRDVKPENCLLDEHGHVHLSDYGLCVRVVDDESVGGYAGTRKYAAPEVVRGKQYRFGVDFWGFGVLLYEMLHFCLPFRNENEVVDGSCDVRFDAVISEHAKSLISQLLQRNYRKRLGHIGDNQWCWSGIRDHPWFASIDWIAIEEKSVVPPFRPDAHAINAPPSYEAERQLLDDGPSAHRSVSTDRFQNFSYNVSLDQQHGGKCVGYAVFDEGDGVCSTTSKPSTSSVSDEEAITLHI